MKTEVHGLNLYGEKIQIPVSDLIFRPSSYGLIINNGKIALMKTSSTGRYQFPGGGVDLGESMEEALRREVKEETGLVIDTAKLIDCNDLFFEYTPEKYCFHSIQFFYLCSVESTELVADDKVNDNEAVMPRWIPIDSLKKEDFQDHGCDVIERLLAII